MIWQHLDSALKSTHEETQTPPFDQVFWTITACILYKRFGIFRKQTTSLPTGPQLLEGQGWMRSFLVWLWTMCHTERLQSLATSHWKWQSIQNWAQGSLDAQLASESSVWGPPVAGGTKRCFTVQLTNEKQYRSWSKSKLHLIGRNLWEFITGDEDFWGEQNAQEVQRTEPKPGFLPEVSYYIFVMQFMASLGVHLHGELSQWQELPSSWKRHNTA